mgnify:CR=1 FL=1
MMVEIKSGVKAKDGSWAVDDMSLTVNSNSLVLIKTLQDGKPEFNLYVTNLEKDLPPFKLTEDEFKTARKKLLAGKPNTVIEVATARTRPWIKG